MLAKTLKSRPGFKEEVSRPYGPARVKVFSPGCGLPACKLTRNQAPSRTCCPHSPSPRTTLPPAPTSAHNISTPAPPNHPTFYIISANFLPNFSKNYPHDNQHVNTLRQRIPTTPPTHQLSLPCPPLPPRNFTHTPDPRPSPQTHPYLDPRITPEETPSNTPYNPADASCAFTPHCRSSAALALNWVLEQEHARRCLIDYRNPDAVMAEFQHWWQIWEDAHLEMATLSYRTYEGEPVVGMWLCDELFRRKRDAVGEILSALRYLEMVVRAVGGDGAVVWREEVGEAWVWLGRALEMWEEVTCEVVGLVVQKRRWKDWWLTAGRFEAKGGDRCKDAGREKAKGVDDRRTEYWNGDATDASV